MNPKEVGKGPDEDDHPAALGDEAAVPVTAFFIPDVGSGGKGAADLYAGIRSRTRSETGFEPRDRRIFRLDFRHDGKDVEAEVGMPDPILGRTVLAILDLGAHRPYVIHCGRAGEDPVHILAPKPVYSVTEFGR